eukprot:CAMPEP_0194276278 /NCGR_PEP_ID=MMETSP0169-20130528/8910_1 /TAXON_ID=218684 /ORGANISM="Corethron pennatum, Strain L29A3" /LENGTH=279 /DNA_ID=CAMNT_0039019961 /DNA_START=6 /DNA_END=845 /DNA_ORIENTATION=+
MPSTFTTMPLLTTLLALMSSSVLGNPLRLSSSTERVDTSEQARDLNAVGLLDYGHNPVVPAYCDDVPTFRARAKNKMIGCRSIRNEYTASKYCGLTVTFREERRQIRTYCPVACGYECHTNGPTRHLSDGPSFLPSLDPSDVPSHAPVGRPSATPSGDPTNGPTEDPSRAPSARPSEVGSCDYSSEQLQVEYRLHGNSYCRTDRMERGSAGHEYDHYARVTLHDCRTKCDRNRACTGFEHYHEAGYGQCEIWYYPSKRQLTEPVATEYRYIDARCSWKR